MRKTKNKNSTKYFSSRQEEYLSELVGGYANSASGAGLFNKSDVKVPYASTLIEAKTPISEKNSFSIKKEWIDKAREEAFSMRLSNTVIAFEFAPSTENFFVIDEKLFKFLMEKLKEEYAN